MDYTVAIIMTLISISYLVYYIFYRYRFNHGIKYTGIIKSYKKYRRFRIYDVIVSNKDKIYVVCSKFLSINSKIVVSDYKDKYYNDANLSSIFIKVLGYALISVILFIYIAISKYL